MIFLLCRFTKGAIGDIIKTTKRSSVFRNLFFEGDKMAKTIGNIIRELRLSRNLTQEQLAENLNITAQAISKWENNVGMPDISQVVPIAHFFGVSTDVLFGIEKDTVIDEVQVLIDNATSQDSYKDEYALLKEALRTYPGDIRVLSELLSCGECLLADGDTIKKESERSIIFEECERAGRLILSYNKNLSDLLSASEWLVKLYCEMGEIGKAAELSETLPSIIGFNKEAALARICEYNSNYETAIECYTTNIAQFQRQLVHSLILCGNMYVHDEKSKKALELYSLAITLSENFIENNPVPQNNSLEKYLAKSIERCKKATEQFSK